MFAADIVKINLIYTAKRKEDNYMEFRTVESWDEDFGKSGKRFIMKHLVKKVPSLRKSSEICFKNKCVFSILLKMNQSSMPSPCLESYREQGCSLSII